MMMVLVSATHQDEPAIGVHMSPPSEASLPPVAPSPPCSCHGARGLSSLRYAANPHWLCLSHMIMCLFQCYFLNSSHPLLLPLGPQVCSLCLHLQEHSIFFLN